MMRWEWRCLFGTMAALIVPSAVLYLFRGEARQMTDLTAAPFAWPTLLLAQLLCALPLGCQLARMLERQPDYRPWSPFVGIAVGTACALLVAALGASLADALSALEMGTLLPLSVRSFLALLLVLPWCITIGPSPAPNSQRHFGIIGLIVLFVPSAWYANDLIAARTNQVIDALNRERLVAAQRGLIGLCEMGSGRSIIGQSPRNQLQRLNEMIPRLQKQAERGGSGIDRAILLIRLERLPEAAQLLEPLAAKNRNALLLLATVRRDQGRWADARTLFQRAWDELAPTPTSEPGIRLASRTALEGIVYCGQRERLPAVVEQILRAGRSAEVLDEAEFAFQLGQHFADAGQPARAAESLREAAQLAPERFAEAAGLRLRQLHMHTPICVLRDRPVQK